jgi:PAS domain S-box-containing protein
MRAWLFGIPPDPARRLTDHEPVALTGFSRLWLPGIGVGLLAIVTLILLPAQSPAADFVYLVTALLCLVVMFGEALTAPRGARGPWWLFFAFEGLAMAAQALAAVDTPAGESAVFPGLVDAVSLAAYVPALAGLGLLINRLRPGRDRESWIDASILTVTGICVFGLFLIAPAFGAPVAGWAEVVAVLYPVLDLALLSALIWLLVGHGRPSVALALVTLSFALTIAASIGRDVGIASDPNQPLPDWQGIVRLAALIAMAAAAASPTADVIAEPKLRATVRVTTPRLALLAIGVLTVPTLLAFRVWQEGGDATVLLALAAMIVIILAVWRIQVLVSTVERQRRVTELVLDSAGDGIVGLDRQGFVLFANLAARRMLRCRESDLLGRRFHDIAHHEHADGTPYPWQECPVSALVTSGESAFLPDQRYVRRDGTAFPVEIVMSPLVVEGAVMGAVQSFRDVSERLEMDEIKRQFVSVVSHELRTPLTSIKGSLQMLDAGVLGPLTDDQQELITMAVSNSERLGQLVNDILDLERLDAGRMPLDPVEVDAIDLARDSATGITGAAEAAGIRLAVEPAPEGTSVAVVADPHRMIQVLTNLLGNAIKFSDRGSTVSIRVSRADDEVSIAVADRGRGIPADQLSSVFDRFGQVDVGDARRGSGTGLGLAIAREIVERSGGRIAVESTMGAGSTFIVTMPAAHALATTPDTTP